MPPQLDPNNKNETDRPVAAVTIATSTVPLSWLGELLIAARKEQGMTQQALGERLGLHQEAVTRMEKEKYRSTSLERLTRIVDALGLNLQIVSEDVSEVEQAAFHPSL